MADTIRIFIGWDQREAAAWHVLAHSLTEHSSLPISITPVVLQHLPWLTRPRDPLQSTEFTYARFAVPWLCDYQGWAIFMDCDMLCVRDPAQLWRYTAMPINPPVWCVQHEHTPPEGTKFLGARQTSYPRKNWSSVMLMDCSRCAALTPAVVNSATGAHLHRFEWLPHPENIGRLPPRWNHLVGWDEPRPVDELGLIHWTEGGPWLPGYEGVEHADTWREAARRAFLMGPGGVG